MKRNYLYGCLVVLALASCGTSKTPAEDHMALKETLRQKNRTSITLLDQIRQLPGITLRYGVPVFAKSTNRIQDNNAYEPLYVLDDYIVGNSFRDVDQLVTNANVKEIKTINGPEASFYGSRGANGIIKIITIK